MNEISPAFIRSVRDRVDNSSTAGQFRECFKMYHGVLYNSEIRSILIDRIVTLRDMHSDRLTHDILTHVEEEIEELTQITSVNNNKAELSFTLFFFADEGKLYDSAITEVVCVALKMADGKKKEAARILGVDTDLVSDLISKRTAIRLFLQKLKRNLKTVDA